MSPNNSVYEIWLESQNSKQTWTRLLFLMTQHWGLPTQPAVATFYFKFWLKYKKTFMGRSIVPRTQYNFAHNKLPNKVNLKTNILYGLKFFWDTLYNTASPSIWLPIQIPRISNQYYRNKLIWISCVKRHTAMTEIWCRSYKACAVSYSTYKFW